MATTVTNEELDTLSNSSSKVSTLSDGTTVYEGKFVGELVGNATTAKELEAPYNLTLSGDATGTTKLNASDAILKVTVTHAEEADTADFAGKTNLAARSTLADMANTAEFAYKAGKLQKFIINLVGLVEGSGTATDTNTLDITISKVDTSENFIYDKLSEDPDTSKIYIDMEGHHLWIYNTTDKKWDDSYEYFVSTLADHGVRIDAIEKIKADDRLKSLEATSADHESRVGKLEITSADHETRMSTLETTATKQGEDLTALTDRVTEAEGAVTTNRENITANANTITALEKTSAEQGTEIAKHGTAITDLEAKVTANSSSIEDLNSKVTTDTGSLATQIETNTADITKLDTRVSSLESSTDAGKLTVDLSEIKADIETNKTNIATIQGKDTEQDESLATIKSSVDELSATKIVTQDTDQSIWGSKTFRVSPFISNGYPKFKLQNNNIDSGTNTDSTENSGLNFYDKNGTDTANRLGYIEYQQNALPEDTTADYAVNQVVIIANTQSTEEGAVDGVLGVATTKQGKAYAYAPTPNIEDVSNKVATTEWVNNVATSKIDALSNNITNDLNELKTSLVDNYVTLASEQEITGNKTFKGTLKATTPTSDTVDTTVATTAWANSVLTPIANRVSVLESSVAYTNKLLNLIYPIGSIYMSVNNVSPASFLGGTWVALQNRFLIGAGQEYAVNSTGGSTTHTLTIAEMPSHNHTFSGNSLAAHSHSFGVHDTDASEELVNYMSEQVGFTWGTTSTKGINYSDAMVISGGISSTGSSQAHSIMNPYLAVYMWKRTA